MAGQGRRVSRAAGRTVGVRDQRIRGKRLSEKAAAGKPGGSERRGVGGAAGVKSQPTEGRARGNSRSSWIRGDQEEGVKISSLSN